MLILLHPSDACHHHHPVGTSSNAAAKVRKKVKSEKRKVKNLLQYPNFFFFLCNFAPEINYYGTINLSHSLICNGHHQPPDGCYALEGQQAL
jgi:hypothetical protein